MLTDQNVLITGAGGSVGRTLAHHLLDSDLSVLRLLDNNEPALAQLQSNLTDDRCRFLAGDIRNQSRLDRAMEDIDTVFHTAAMKHVDVCEYNPFEAVRTNALGLQNVVDAAIDADVDRFVFTSSDKAVNPANTMGTTKLLGEKLVTAGNKYRGKSDIKLCSVRFGNVLNSSQSVIPIFRDQIKNGGPITLTDERMTRFFLTYNDVVDLVTSAAEKTAGGEVFIYKMPAIKITDLAQAMIELHAIEAGYDPEEINVETIGRRPGETFHEELLTKQELAHTVENENMYAVLPESNGNREQIKTELGTKGFTETTDVTLSSGDADHLGISQIKSLLQSAVNTEVNR